MLRHSFVLLAVLLACQFIGADRLRCERPDYISNGSYRLKRNFMRVACNTGYQLQGLKTIGCVRGKWDGERPVCAKKGCDKKEEAPDNGRIQIESGLKAILYCSDNFSLAGNRYSYCNGSHWDRPIGTCREKHENVSHQCDFETDDVCGWTYETRENLEWKRVMAANVFTSFKTGPRRDHTTLTHNGGHYMLMESLVRQYMPVTLTSPIYDRELSLKTACCFQFYYFMYGAGIGDLLVVVKPLSVTLDDILISQNELIKFERNGNQNNNWNEAHFLIEELEEDFQIVFVAKSGRNQLSDIAIDDVRLLIGDDCKKLDTIPEEAMSVEEFDTTTYQSLFEVQSCVGRCYNSSGVGIVLRDGHLMGLCSCDIDCEDAETCCPDFKMLCANDLFETSSADYYSNAPKIINKTTETTVATSTAIRDTTAYTMPSVVKPVPTSTTIKTLLTTTTPTSTPQPTTTSTTKGTTTRKTAPITSRKPTTTTTRSTTSTTTKAPTTSTTRMTTTTTRKPSRSTTTTTGTTRKPSTSTTTTTTTTRKPSTSTTTTTTTTTTERTTAKTTPTTPRKSIITTPTSTAKPTTPKEETNTVRNATTLKDFDHPPRSVNVTKRPAGVSKKTSYIIDSDAKVEAAHRGSNFLTWVLILIVIILALGVLYRRYGNHAVAWYMIHFSKNGSGDEETSSITTRLWRSTTTAEKSDRANREKSRKQPYFSSDMNRPLVDEDEEDDESISVNGNKILADHIYTEL